MTSTTTSTEDDLLKSIQRIQSIKLDDGSSFTVVDCDSALSEMVDTLAGLPVAPPSIYVDLEGVNLSRQGTVSILQLYVLPKDYTYLIDVHQLQHSTFSTTGKKSDKCLKAILEAKDIPKVFFDVRNDSDALFHHFQISLSGVEDIQLMELATRTFSRKCVNGLQRCIENDAVMTVAEKAAWLAAKEGGVKLFAPEKGGRYEVFNDRPLAKEIIQYCVQDVQFLRGSGLGTRKYCLHPGQQKYRWRQKNGSRCRKASITEATASTRLWLLQDGIPPQLDGPVGGMMTIEQMTYFHQAIHSRLSCRIVDSLRITKYSSQQHE